MASTTAEDEQNMLSPRTLKLLSADSLIGFDTGATSLNEALTSTGPMDSSSMDQNLDPSLRPLLSANPGQDTPTSKDVPAGPSRRQNVACDQCRTKKVRCPRDDIASVCYNCSSRKLACTSNYVAELHEKAKHARLSKESSSGPRHQPQKRKRKSQNGDLLPVRTPLTPLATAQSSHRTTLASQEDVPEMKYFFNPARPSSDLRPSEKQANCYRYLLAPNPVTHNLLGYSDLSSLEMSEGPHCDSWEEQGGRVWKEDPTEAHAGLTDVGLRELADDLVESYFTMANPRFPMLDPVSIRARVASPDTHPEGPVPHGLLAVMMAFGARFSDHAVINTDREECMDRDERAFGAGQRPPRSRITQLLVIRAREVVEIQKTHRIATMTNIQILVLAELMLGRVVFLRDRYQPYNFTSAIRLARQLGYANPKYIMSLTNDKEKEAAVYLWSIICVSDGYVSLFHRLQSTLNDVSEDILALDLTTALPNPAPGDAGHRMALWFSAVSTGSKMAREVSNQLWSFKTMEQGIPLSLLEQCISSFSTWRNNHLSNIAVPTNWPTTWSFESAITAVTTDAYYHNMWLVLERAIKEIGIQEQRGPSPMIDPSTLQRLESAKSRIHSEAEHGAHRIATLTSILALSHYIRLDPLLLHSPIYEAGLYLAEQGREDCMALVAGLRQHCISYPQFWSAAEEIERLYNARVLAGTPHSASNTPARPVGPPEFSLPISTGSPMMSSPTNMSAPYGGSGRKGMEGPGSNGLAGNGEERDVALSLFEWLHQV